MERAPGLLIWPTWFQRSRLSISRSGRKIPMDSQNFPFFPPFFLVNSGRIIESSTTMHHTKLGVFLIPCRPRSNTSFYIANVAGQHPLGLFGGWEFGWRRNHEKSPSRSATTKAFERTQPCWHWRCDMFQHHVQQAYGHQHFMIFLTLFVGCARSWQLSWYSFSAHHIEA